MYTIFHLMRMTHNDITQKIIAFSITVFLILLIFFILAPPTGIAVHLHPGMPSYTAPLYNTSKTVTFNDVELTIRGDEAIPVTYLTFSICRNSTNEEIASVQFFINGTEKPDSDAVNRFTVINITNTSNLPYEENGSFFGYDEQTGETPSFTYGYGYTGPTTNLTIKYTITYTTHITGTLYGQLIVNSSTYIFTSAPSKPFTVLTPPEDINATITTLLVGWNFVSLPFNQTIPKVNLTVIYETTEYTWTEAKNTGILIDTIFQWNRSVPQTYWPTSTLTPGYGYWIYAYQTCELVATNITPIVTDGFITTLSIQWNIFGVPVNESVDKTSLIVNYLGTDYNWTEATTNDNPTGGPIIVKDLFDWNRTIQGYLPVSVLNPGYCYWIYCYYPCILKRIL